MKMQQVQATQLWYRAMFAGMGVSELADSEIVALNE